MQYTVPVITAAPFLSKASAKAIAAWNEGAQKLNETWAGIEATRRQIADTLRQQRPKEDAVPTPTQLRQALQAVAGVPDNPFVGLVPRVREYRLKVYELAFTFAPLAKGISDECAGTEAQFRQQTAARKSELAAELVKLGYGEGDAAAFASRHPDIGRHARQESDASGMAYAAANIGKYARDQVRTIPELLSEK